MDSLDGPASETSLPTPDNLDPDAFDPLVPRVAQQAITRCPIKLPWQARRLPMGMFFRSSATATGNNPFSSESAFDSASLSSAPVIFTAYDGNSSYRSSEVRQSSASSEHLSVSVGASVDLVFLEASVSMQYDRDVMENKDSNKASVMTSYRAGSVTYARVPKLSEEAFGVFRRQGLGGFVAEYGDYYVGGYRIGADASVLFSTDTSSRTEKEAETVSITVETLLEDYHDETSSSSSNTQSRQEIRISAFPTIEQLVILETVQTGTMGFQAAIQRGRETHRRAQGVEDSVAAILKDIGVREKKLLTRQQCGELCERALVVELLLVPIESLRQVRYWTIAM